MARSKEPRADGDRVPSRRALAQRLESLRDAGVVDLPGATARSRRRAGAQAAPPPVPDAPRTPQPSGEGAAPPPKATSDVSAALDILRTEVGGCRACSSLAAARTNTVFGSGNPAARLCFLGEAPGADEDACGEPFVGRAGQLLTKIIESCALSRDEVYILNVLKCRPPDNRRPEPTEVANCRGFFERQIDLIRPEFICCLGASAAQALLRTEETIGRLRGRWFEHGSSQVICTYHPSYLLRNPAAKRDVWDDMKRLMARMGIAVPGH